jgi:1,4-alpha-glucan branching enzyme
MAIGSFCLVLHGHLPYVLRHGTWPHGEDWIYEAAAETYLPLLAMIDECQSLGGHPRLALGLTPVLLEQLSHDHFKTGMERYLDERAARARADHADFSGASEPHLAWLATQWERHFRELAVQFAGIDHDLPRAFAKRARAGMIEMLTSCATHAYLPLLYEDSSVRGQLRAGMASSERILGFRPSGFWLPECAYRPPGDWRAPVPWGEGRLRPGTESYLAAEGISHFFVESHLIEHSRSEWSRNDEWHKVGWDEPQRTGWKGWGSVLEPARVASNGTDPGATVAFARDPAISKRVWCDRAGYPGDGVYLEFHKKHGPRRGLRYWKVTKRHLGLGEKDPYYPDDVPGKIHEHASHFCDEVRNRLRGHHHGTGRHGAVVACFDAELFGHWWHEGPRFLRDVLLTLNADPEVDLTTPAAFLERHDPDKAVAMSEGSWGDGGDHRVWTGDRVRWMWDVEYRMEAIFGRLTYNLPWRQEPKLREILEKAGRELLLLQASDWPFVISCNQAVDYGIKRFMQHVGRFESLTDVAERVAADPAHIGRLTDVERFGIQDADIHDVVFPEIDLEWWSE